jgi:predicted component of type VI protein secretion system
MEGLIIIFIWLIGSTIVRNANNNNKNYEGKTPNTTNKQNRKNVFSTFIEELEKEKQRLERPTRTAQPSMLSDNPKPKAPSKPKAPPKPVGLEIDVIGGDEEIGAITEANTSIGSKYNNIDLDLRKDLLKGIIYSEILSKPKSLKNMKRRI